MTTHQIAKRAGVSQATVSRVINNHPGVSAEKMAMVRQAMNQLGYMPTPSRRRVAAGGLRYNSVGVLVLATDMFRDYSSVFTKSQWGVSRALSDRRINMIHADVQKPEQLPPAVAARQVDGLILAGGSMPPELAPHLEQFPASWISSRHGASGDAVLAGNELIGRMAADYLLGRGHKHLAILNAFGGTAPMVARQDFFMFTAQRAGADVAHLVADAPAQFMQSATIDLDAVEQCVAQQVDRLLALDPRPTGLFVMMDYQVAMVYRVLARHGMRPGPQLDIIGCDDEKSTRLSLYPRPATIAIAAEAIGRRAVEQLLWRIAHPHEESRMHVVVEPQLIPGEIPMTQ
ncbi:MAG: LacI family DNA-binding transcriptional regulator [Phycisphaeraceae bacterium]|nr:LacI family DNA-binding transcriptional regulator [Phycisphaeraceae bacterium]